MRDTRGSPTRRQYLAAGATLPLVGLAGCVDGFEETLDDAGGGSGGPLRVAGTRRLDDGGRTVRVAVTVENTGDEARSADLVVELSHTEADGSIDRTRALLVPPDSEQTVTVAFEPMFVGENGAGRPDEGEFRFDPRFENVAVLEDFPGLVTPTERSALAGGDSWPSARYDPGGSAHNPGTSAPRSDPTPAWTAPNVGHAFDATGPVVADGTVYAGRPVTALSDGDGAVQWVHDGPARTGPLAVGDGVVVFGTVSDLRAVDAETGERRWSVPSPDGNWEGAATVADGRVYASNGGLYAIDAVSGEVEWTEETAHSLLGPPPVADGVVLAGGDPLLALDATDGSVRWSASGTGRVVTAAVAYDTVFALGADQLTALDLAEGRTRWFFRGSFQDERIAVGNGAVYAQNARRYQPVAVDAATGEVMWVCEATDGLLGPPSAAGDVLLVQNESDAMYAIDTATGDLRWSLGISISRPGTVPIADGVCYVNEVKEPLKALAATG